MFSYVDIEGLIPDGDPIRKVRKVVDEALLGMGDVFEAMYAGRDARRFRRSSCSGRWWFRSSTPSARSVNS